MWSPVVVVLDLGLVALGCMGEWVRGCGTGTGVGVGEWVRGLTRVWGAWVVVSEIVLGVGL